MKLIAIDPGRVPYILAAQGLMILGLCASLHLQAARLRSAETSLEEAQARITYLTELLGDHAVQDNQPTVITNGH